MYWAFGAVLNVPFLAAGEVQLLARNRTVDVVVYVVLVFLVAYVIAVLRHAAVDAGALAQRLPSGKHVFGDGSPAHRLPQLISIPSFTVLLLGTLWSAWKMRGRPELRDRFVRHAADRGGRVGRGRWRHVRGARQPARLLHHARRGSGPDVRRLPARVAARRRSPRAIRTNLTSR